MLRLLLAAVAVLFVIPASAQVHQATPLEVLLARLGVAHEQHHHDMAGRAQDAGAMKWDGGAVTVDANAGARGAVSAIATTNAVKTFTIIARQFEFEVTPSPFVVNVGDDVTLNISVPADDGSAVGHGFFLEGFMDNQLGIARGRSVAIHFVATSPGTFTYLCTTSCGTGHPTMNGILTVLAQPQAAAPSITSISPNNGPASGGNVVTIAGANFQGGATVSFGGLAATNVNVVSSSSITAHAPAHAAGRVNVVVTNPDNQTGTFDGYTYAAAVSITSVTPNTGPATGGTAITISGSGFVAGATVKIGGLVASVLTVSATTITATTPAMAPTEQLTLPRDVVVTNPDGSSATLAGAFSYTLPPFSVRSIDPAGASPDGGVQATITGTGFNGAVNTIVTFGGVAATNVAVLSTTSMRVTVPPHAAGVVDVKITVGSNTVTLANGFTYGTVPVRKRAARH